MKRLALIFASALCLGCSAVQGVPPIESAVRSLHLRNSPPPHLPMLVFPPDRSPENRFSIEIRKVGPYTSPPQHLSYGGLKGDRVYSIYINTALGTVVMEYSDPSSADHAYSDDLIGPQPVRANLPAHLKLSRLVISCVLDRSGSLKRAQVQEQNGTTEITNQKILAALSGWKFRPAFRGDEPVEVTALLGFDIDTR